MIKKKKKSRILRRREGLGGNEEKKRVISGGEGLYSLLHHASILVGILLFRYSDFNERMHCPPGE